MEQQKLEKLMAFAFIFVGIAFFLLLLGLLAVIPFSIASIFIILATFVALVAGFVLYKDSRQE